MPPFVPMGYLLELQESTYTTLRLGEGTELLSLSRGADAPAIASPTAANLKVENMLLLLEL